MELGLVVGHDALDAVLVEVARDLFERPAAVLELLEAPLIERDVVGLEPDLSAGGQEVEIQLLKTRGREAALELLLFGPGVGEVYVDALHLAGCEELGQQHGVAVEEADVRELGVAHALHGDDHGVGDFFDGAEQRVGLGGGHAGGEAALAAAQLKAETRMSREIFEPAPAVDFRCIFKQLGALFPARHEVGLFSHSQVVSHSAPMITYPGENFNEEKVADLRLA